MGWCWGWARKSGNQVSTKGVFGPIIYVYPSFCFTLFSLYICKLLCLFSKYIIDFNCPWPLYGCLFGNHTNTGQRDIYCTSNSVAMPSLKYSGGNREDNTLYTSVCFAKFGKRQSIRRLGALCIRYLCHYVLGIRFPAGSKCRYPDSRPALSSTWYS